MLHEFPVLKHHPSLFKAMIVPAAWIAILIWAMVKVPPSISLANQQSTVSGSALVWAWFSSMNSALGNYATLAVNIPDFTVSTMACWYLQSLHWAVYPLSKSELEPTSTCSGMLRTNARKCNVYGLDRSLKKVSICSQYIQAILIPTLFTLTGFVGKHTMTYGNLNQALYVLTCVNKQVLR